MVKKILIVDDEPAALKLFVNKFQKEGFEVLTATDGRSCLKAAAQEKPDLILLDIVLPDMNGFQACKILKSLETTRMIKIIVFTNKLDAVNASEARHSGADEFIEKMADSQILLQTIKRLVV